MACRHCSSCAARATYASVIVCGSNDVHQTIEFVENKGIVPCVTAICGGCGRVSLILHEGSKDPFAHSLAMWERYGKFIATSP
jgi:hypothetical protein